MKNEDFNVRQRLCTRAVRNMGTSTENVLFCAIWMMQLLSSQCLTTRPFGFSVLEEQNNDIETRSVTKLRPTISRSKKHY